MGGLPTIEELHTFHMRGQESRQRVRSAPAREQVAWLCQVEPTAALLPALPTCGLTIDLYVSPAQVRLRTLTGRAAQATLARSAAGFLRRAPSTDLS